MNHELTKDFINAHLNDDVNKLALSKFPDDIDKQFVIRQIQARQLLKKKLPSWSENDELLFPKRLSLEQCSSELTAKYKRAISRKVTESQRCRSQGVRSASGASCFRGLLGLEDGGCDKGPYGECTDREVFRQQSCLCGGSRYRNRVHRLA